MDSIVTYLFKVGLNRNQISAIRGYRIGLNTDFSSVKVMVLRSLV